MKKVEQIEQDPIALRWDLSLMYEDDARIQADRDQVAAGIERLQTLSKDPSKHLLEIFQQSARTGQIISKLSAYAHMKRDEDSTVDSAQKLALEIDSLDARYEAAVSFIEPYILSLEEASTKSLLEEEAFAPYRRLLKHMLRNLPHRLSAQEEDLLVMAQEMGASAQNAFYMLSYADLQFPVLENAPSKERLSHANYTAFLAHPNRALRQEAFEKMYQTYDQYKNTFAATLSGSVRNAVLKARRKKFSSAREMPLFADDVPVQVYDQLIDSVHQILPDHHRYLALRKEMLGVDDLHMYDLYVPAVQADQNPVIPFDRAREMVVEALAVLGDEYKSIIEQAFESRWIDVLPREGKKSGAYSFGSYESAPYILLNYNGTLDSVFTLAHELGHSVHSYYSRKHNPFLDASYTIFVAEVASTLNEMLLFDYLFKKAQSEQEKAALLDHRIFQFRQTLLRQTMFAEFEKIIHEKSERDEALTADAYSGIYYALNQQYFGENMQVDPLIALEWARIPHFYTNFYVYKYATGLSAATHLSQGILEGRDGALERYLDFLKDGARHYPIEQLRQAGADMRDPATVRQALAVFTEAVDALEKLR